MDLGLPEILIILALALLFFGPSKLPGLGKSLGEAIRGFKKGLKDVDQDLNPPHHSNANSPGTVSPQLGYKSNPPITNTSQDSEIISSSSVKSKSDHSS